MMPNNTNYYFLIEEFKPQCAQFVHAFAIHGEDRYPL
jgi:hypothetical protein